MNDISEREYKELDNILLDKNGKLKLIKAAALKNIPQQNIACWCRKNSIYSIVTTELIDWLKDQIKDKVAIEIGAGKNILGKELGIVQTDSYIQNTPEVVEKFIQMRQPIIEYPERVQKYEAREACTRYRPQVVIGTWITQLGGSTVPQSSPYGVNETKVVNWVEKYILIGHEDSHNMKKIMDIPHKTYEFPWLYSRAMNVNGNKIWVWETT
jgi:hypothetical protein